MMRVGCGDESYCDREGRGKTDFNLFSDFACFWTDQADGIMELRTDIGDCRVAFAPEKLVLSKQFVSQAASALPRPCWEESPNLSIPGINPKFCPSSQIRYMLQNIEIGFK